MSTHQDQLIEQLQFQVNGYQNELKLFQEREQDLKIRISQKLTELVQELASEKEKNVALTQTNEQLQQKIESQVATIKKPFLEKIKSLEDEKTLLMRKNQDLESNMSAIMKRESDKEKQKKRSRKIIRTSKRRNKKCRKTFRNYRGNETNFGINATSIRNIDQRK